MAKQKLYDRVSRWALFNNERGAVLLIVAISLVVLIGMASLAVDVGYVAVTRNELQNVADAAALAATRKISSIYEQIGYDHTHDWAGDSDAIKQIAVGIGNKNGAAGKTVSILTGDVKIGRWQVNSDTGLGIFTPDVTPPNAVRVTTRRDGQANSPITVFFAKIFTLVGASDNVANVPVAATATAALTGQCRAQPGELPPFGISDMAEYCNSGTYETPIQFYGNPTGDTSCAGWQMFFMGANSSNLNEILQGMIDKQIQNGASCHREYGQTQSDASCWENAQQAQKALSPYTSPAVNVGDKLNFSNGDIQNAYPCMKNLYDCMKERNPDGSESWHTDTPIYHGDCSPGGGMTVIGFGTVEILSVNPSAKTITAKVNCNMVVPDERGGCKSYGTYGSLPGLVDKGPGT